MRSFLAKSLMRLAHWVRPKNMPYVLAGPQWTGTSYVDSFRRTRQPTPNEILAELKNTAWTCASINAATCANYPPRLYVITEHHQPQPKCATKALSPWAERRLRSLPHLSSRIKSAARIEEVTTHPLLTLLQHANVVHNQFDLWELTTLYQEVHGSAYWYLDMDPVLDVPRAVWILPSQNMTPRRDPDSKNLVDYYLYRNGASEVRKTQQNKPLLKIVRLDLHALPHACYNVLRIRKLLKTGTSHAVQTRKTALLPKPQGVLRSAGR